MSLFHGHNFSHKLHPVLYCSAGADAGSLGSIRNTPAMDVESDRHETGLVWYDDQAIRDRISGPRLAASG